MKTAPKNKQKAPKNYQLIVFALKIALRYLRHISTPHRLGDRSFENPIELPNNLFYHQEYGQYFKTPQELTEYLKQKQLYHEAGQSLLLSQASVFR